MAKRADKNRAKKVGRARKLSFSFGANARPSTANARAKRSGKGGGS